MIAGVKLSPWQELLLAARLAVRDLRGGFQGLVVFIGCLAVGVAAIVAVETIARGLSQSLDREGRSILGGDIAWSLSHRQASDAEQAYVARFGLVSTQASARAMARTPERQTLAEVKAVDKTYPLAGQLLTTPQGGFEALFGLRNGLHGAVAEAALLEKLDLKVGDRLMLAGLALEIRASLEGEPDKLSGGIGFGPRLIISTAAFKESTLMQPGSLVRWTYRVAMPAASQSQLKAVAEEGRRLFPDAGWEIRTRANASQQLSSNIARFTQFLDLVGLTALLIGGVGVANAAAAQIEARRATIATFKALGASGGFAAKTYLIQAGLVAGAGIAAGIVIGLILPFMALQLFAELLPLPVSLSISPFGIGQAIFYGLAISFAFAVWSLGLAHDVPVQALYREDHLLRRRPRLAYVIAAIAAGAAIVTVAILTAEDWRVPAVYAVAALSAFIVLRATAHVVVLTISALPRQGFLPLRLALTSLHRPGAPTAAVILSLGLGLTLLVALGLIDANLRRQLVAALPERAPTFYLLDLRSSELAAFRSFVERAAPQAKSETVPLLRGRIVKLNGVPAEEIRPSADSAWVLSGDRGLTVADSLPDNSRLVDGQWWSSDNTRPLVSFEDKIARGLGVRVGDIVTVNVLGRNIEAEIANTRTVKWETLGINFVMLFSPATFRGAPMSELATLTLAPGANAGDETRFLKQLSEAFPAVTAIRVKEALEAINVLVGKLATAVRGATGVALIASLLVLGGAIAASHRARLFDAVILKTLGATSRTLLAALAVEFLLLGLITALIGVIAGHAVAFVVVIEVMKVDFDPSLTLAAVVTAMALAVTLAIGLAGAWSLLRQRPARLLRAI